MQFLVRTFGWSVAVTVAVLVGAGWLGGWGILLTVAMLSILEVSLSFDNAVINASVLERMSAWWQRIFLTIGIAIAVFGMRLVFPLLVVSATAHVGPIEAIRMALDEPTKYEAMMTGAMPAISAFGGIFLLMIFLDFVFEDRDITWLRWIEKPLARIGKLDQLSVVISLGVLAASAQWIAPAEKYGTVLISGLLGIATYLLVNGLGELFEGKGEGDEEDDPKAGIHGPADKHVVERKGPNGLVVATGKAAFFLFLYLEVLDASFSFDGVVGAFALSNQIFVIAAGLGVGAMYIRSLTVYLVRKGTLQEYVYLEHGAHWAIGALAVILFLGMNPTEFHVNEIISGLIGVFFIAVAFISSVIRNKRNGGAEESDDDSDEAEPASETAKV